MINNRLSMIGIPRGPLYFFREAWLVYLFFHQTWFKFFFFRDSWFLILRSFYVHMNVDFGFYMTHELRVEFVVIRELSCFAWLNFRLFWCSSKCAPFFSSVVAFWTDEPFDAYFVASITKFLRFYVFSKQQSKQGLLDQHDFCMNVKTFW